MGSTSIVTTSFLPLVRKGMHLKKHLRLTHRESNVADSADTEPTITLGRSTQWTEPL